MENEYREREKPETRYEQYSTENPMDAVRNKRGRKTDPEELRTDPKASKKTKRGAAESVAAGSAGNEYREREKPAEPQPQKEKKEKKAGPAKRPNLLVQVLNGDILTRDFVLNNLTFIFFLLFLLLLMVAKGYYGKQLARDIDTVETEVRAKTAEYIENKARLEESTARFRLVEALEKRGLKETVNPAKVIRLKPEVK
jgi:cell division protein FtsL